MTMNEVRALALVLSSEERELLGVELLGTLESSETQDEVDGAWAKEILARSESLRTGQIQALDAEGTFERLRKRLAARVGS